MGHPARHEIEKHAKNEFAVAQERIAVKNAEKQQALLQVTLRGNIGGYAPALTELKAKLVRQHVIALADAYVKAFNLFGVPSKLRQAQFQPFAVSLTSSKGRSGEPCTTREAFTGRSNDPSSQPSIALLGQNGACWFTPTS